MRIETPATIVHCLPGARVPDIFANVKVLANAKHKSEITKNNVKEVCELASTTSDTVICSGPLPAYHGDEIHSRLSKWCPSAE